MFNLFRKKAKKYPPFEVLAGHADKDFYFVRCASWMWLTAQHIVVWDPVNPLRHITFDPWPQSVFLHADGEMTVAEYIYFLAGEYSGEIPDKLDEFILNELHRLQGLNVLELRTEQGRPEAKFDQAMKKEQ